MKKIIPVTFQVAVFTRLAIHVLFSIPIIFQVARASRCILKSFKSLLVLLLIVFSSAAFSGEKLSAQTVSPLPKDSDPSLIQLLHPKNKVSVLEFFNYGCPACQQLEPDFQEWLKKQSNYIKLTRIPMVFDAAWTHYEKAHYIATQLDVLPQMTQPLFTAGRTGNLLNSEKSMEDLFVKYAHVTPNLFQSVYHFSIFLSGQTMKSNFLRQHYKIYAIPTFVIDGKYKIDLRMAGSKEKFFNMLDQLIHRSLSKKHVA